MVAAGRWEATVTELILSAANWGGGPLSPKLWRRRRALQAPKGAPASLALRLRLGFRARRPTRFGGCKGPLQKRAARGRTLRWPS